MKSISIEIHDHWHGSHGECCWCLQLSLALIGAVALVLHGSPRVTRDLDICYARDHDNLGRLAQALAPFEPRLRGAPPDLPFTLDTRTLHAGLNFTLMSAAGDIDLESG